MESTFSAIQNNIFKFLVKQNKLKAQESNAEKIDFSSLYDLLKISAPSDGIDLESPEGIEYLKGLVDEFMKLDYIKTMADDNKDGTLSVKEKGDFMNEELELKLSAAQLEKLFGKDIEEIEEVSDVSSSGGSNVTNYNSGSTTPTTNNTGNTTTTNTNTQENNNSTEQSKNAQVESARQEMLAAEEYYQESLKDNFENNQEVINLEQDRSIKNQDIQEKQDEKNTLSDESNQLTVTISDLETQISEKDSAISDLQGQLAALSSAGDDENGNDNSAEIAAIQAQIAQLEQEKADLESEKKDAEDRKSEIDDKLIPDLDSAIETVQGEITEIENQIKEKTQSNEEVKTAFDDYIKAREEYNKLNADYLAEEKANAEKQVAAEKALRQDPKLGVENDKDYENVDDVLYESKIKDSIKEYTKNFADDSKVSYSHTSSGNYEVKEERAERADGTIVVTTFDRNGEVASTRSSSLSALTTEQESKVVEAVNAKTEGKEGNIEYSKTSDGTITATIKSDDGKVVKYSFNKDGELISSDDMDEIITDNAAKETAATLPIPVGASVNYKKDGDNYVVTVTDKNGVENSYKYDKEAKLVSSTNIESVAPDKRETVQAALQGVVESGEKLEYKENEDGTYTVVGTYGGIEITYKFDKDGNYIGSSDYMDASKDRNTALYIKYATEQLAGTDNSFSYKKEDDGSITVTTDNNGSIKFDKDGNLLTYESSSISGFKTLTAEEQKTITDFISSKNIEGNITYRYDNTKNEYIIEADNNGQKTTYSFGKYASGTVFMLVRSQNLEDVVSEEDYKDKINETLKDLVSDEDSVQYLKDFSNGIITAEVTDKDGNISKYTIGTDGSIVKSSDITKIGITDESVINKISEQISDENKDNSFFEIDQDGNIIATTYSKSGIYTEYIFSASGELKQISSIESDNVILDKDLEEKINNQLRKLGINSYHPLYTQNEDGSISVGWINSQDIECVVDFDKDGNMSRTNSPDLLFENTSSTDYALAVLENILELDISAAEYSLTPNGNIKVVAKKDGEDYTVTFDPKHGDCLFISDKEFAWEKFSTEAQSNAEKTLQNMGVDTSSILYSGDSDTHFSACVIVDGYEVNYQFDENGNLVKYTNALGTFEQKTDESGKAYIEYTSSSYPKTTTNVTGSDLSTVAKQYTSEMLKQLTSYKDGMQNISGTDAEKLAAVLEDLNISNLSMTTIYNETQTAEKENGVYPTGTIVIINPTSVNDEIVTAQAGIVAGTVQTAEGTKYIVLEPGANGEVKVVIRDENGLEFRSK